MAAAPRPDRALGVEADAVRVAVDASAQTRRFDRLPSASMSNAVSRPANDSATISVALSGVTTMPFGNEMRVGHLPYRPVRCDQHDHPGRIAVGRLEVAPAVHVHVPAPVDHDLVPVVRQPAEVGVRHLEPSGSWRMRPSPVSSSRPSGSHAIDHPRPGGPAPDDLAGAVEIDGDDLAARPNARTTAGRRASGAIRRRRAASSRHAAVARCDRHHAGQRP